MRAETSHVSVVVLALSLGCDGRDCEKIEREDSFLGFECVTTWSDCPDESGYSDYKTDCGVSLLGEGVHCTCEKDDRKEAGAGFSLNGQRCADASDANAGCGWSLLEE